MNRRRVKGDGSVPSRRQHGTGSVYQRASDGRWLGTIDHGYTKTGGRARVTVTGRTEAEAKAKLKAKAREIARGEDTAGRTTVKAWAETWLSIAAQTNRPKTQTADEAAMKWIVATIGHRRLDQLTPADIRAVRTALVNEGRSTSTALRYHGTLVRMLKAARDEGHDVPARVLAVRPPAKATNDRQAIPTVDAITMLAVATELPHASRWAAAFLQGMRQGECLGLTWDHVDLDARTLTVRWQLQAVPYLDKRDRSKGFRLPDGLPHRHLAGRMHLTPPKSKKGHRVIPLVPWMETSLRAWREIAPDSPHGLVWPALDGSPASLTEDEFEFKRIQDTLGVRHPTGRHYLIHEARHATATLLAELKVPESIRIQIMGHSTIASTRPYEHDLPESAREALAQVAVRLELR